VYDPSSTPTTESVKDAAAIEAEIKKIPEEVVPLLKPAPANPDGTPAAVVVPTVEKPLLVHVTVAADKDEVEDKKVEILSSLADVLGVNQHRLDGFVVNKVPTGTTITVSIPGAVAGSDEATLETVKTRSASVASKKLGTVMALGCAVETAASPDAKDMKKEAEMADDINKEEANTKIDTVDTLKSVPKPAAAPSAQEQLVSTTIKADEDVKKAEMAKKESEQTVAENLGQVAQVEEKKNEDIKEIGDKAALKLKEDEERVAAEL
jgi:hypothetical protein